MPIFFAVLVGFICGKIVYNYYRDSIYEDLSQSKLYLVLGGNYNTYEDMREENSSNNYVYYIDDDGYKTVIGITRNVDNIEKIQSLYDNDTEVSEYYINDLEYRQKQDIYDLELTNASDVYEVKEVVDNILNLYRSDDSIKLVSIY